MAISGAAVAYCVTGGIVAYSGIKGSTISDTVKAVLSGNLTVTSTEPISATVSAGTPGTGSGGSAIGNAAVAGASAGSGQPVANNGSAQAILQQTAAQFGWGSGPQWQALSSVEMAEAGFNPNATNPQSGAYGLAQALGHGQGSATQGTVTNEYGGYGLSAAQAKLANSGNAAMQALWMCNYIKDTYGSPAAAWAHEQADHWY